MKRGIDEQSLADDLGISVLILRKLENEKMILNPALMLQICEYFGVELHEMFYLQKTVQGGNFI